MDTPAQYRELKRPAWAPPAWVFGPVWGVLYALIAVSFSYVGYLYYAHAIPFSVLLPFVLNLIFNLAYTPIQFRLRNLPLASLDVVLVLATLLWAAAGIYSIAPWVAYINIPYVLWASFATALQLTITVLNRS
jgi:tryptophan-rich sensory protein